MVVACGWDGLGRGSLGRVWWRGVVGGVVTRVWRDFDLEFTKFTGLKP